MKNRLNNDNPIEKDPEKIRSIEISSTFRRVIENLQANVLFKRWLLSIQGTLRTRGIMGLTRDISKEPYIEKSVE